MRKFFFIIFIVFGLSGCATWTQMVQREYQEKGKGFKAEMPGDWMRYNLGPAFILTKDGITLNIIFVERIKYAKKLEHTKKIYFEGMSIQELVETEIDNIRSNEGIDKFQIISNQPQTIDGREAFRVEYTYAFLPAELKVHGIQYGFMEGKWIYRIRFEAAEQHYFKQTIKDFERFIKSFRVI